MDWREYQKMRELEDGYWWYVGLRALVCDAIARYQPGCGAVLDAGCGTGGMLALLQRQRPHARLVGFDLSPEAVTLCHDRGLPAIVRASVNQIPMRSASFDVVTCTDVLYFGGIDERAATGEIFRLLRGGGIAIWNVAAFEFLRSLHDRFVGTRRRFRRREMVSLLEKSGFRVLQATYWNSMLFPAIALVRILRRNSSHVPESDLRSLTPLLNSFLGSLLRAEACWIRRVSLPVGTSVFCVAERPA